MNTTLKKLVILSIFIVLSLFGSACSDSNRLIGNRNIQDSDPFAGSDTIEGLADRFLPEGMLAFEGSVFVASTKPSNNRWYLAGWQIAVKPLILEDDSIPADCTLYPHQGVDDQWIGSCTGYTIIPRDGANHIAVMHTQPDGTTTLVQVAPPPDTNEP